MPDLRRKSRASQAALGLAVVLALGFAADAVVFMTTRARAEGAPAAVESAQGGRSPSRGLGDEENVSRAPHATLVRQLTKGARPVGSGPWSLAMIGITLALAALGGIVAAGRRFGPQSPGMGMQVVGRVSLSPKHSVYMLRVGPRALLIGTGPQGSPSLISELDDLPPIESGPTRGELP